MNLERQRGPERDVVDPLLLGRHHVNQAKVPAAASGDLDSNDAGLVRTGSDRFPVGTVVAVGMVALVAGVDQLPRNGLPVDENAGFERITGRQDGRIGQGDDLDRVPQPPVPAVARLAADAEDRLDVFRVALGRGALEDPGLTARLENLEHPVAGEPAHNPWLHELPDPITKVTWDNYASLSPADAARMGLAEGDVKVPGEVTTDICRSLERRPTALWWVGLLASLSVLVLGTAAVSYQIATGIYITAGHVGAMCKLIIATSGIVGLASGIEFFTALYSGNVYEQLERPRSCWERRLPAGPGAEVPLKTRSVHAWAAPTSRLEAGAPSAFRGRGRLDLGRPGNRDRPQGPGSPQRLRAGHDRIAPWTAEAAVSGSGPNMPARDLYHDIVRTALVKDGWTITHDPLTLRWGRTDLFVKGHRI